jgi:phage-related baseplate assembly protein
MAYLLTLERAKLDATARSQLLAYAQKELLDHIGARVYCHRLPAASARTKLVVHLALPAPSVWVMPQGTRVTADKKVYFATESQLVIPQGENEGAVDIVCLTPGAAGNGFAVGQISILVDPLPYVASVGNSTESSAGADVEDDNRYRERIHWAPAQWSTAGPDDAYRYWAMSAHPEIADVAVHSPAPVEVDLYVLLTGGRIPDAPMLDIVRAVFARRDRVPLTDKITVKTPEIVPWSLSCTWWLSRDRESRAGAITLAVRQALDSYIAWQEAGLGRDLNPSELISRLMACGVKRVEVTSPVFAFLEPWELPKLSGEPELVFGGVEGD